MTRNEFVNHFLAACGCEFRDGKEWFEKEELINCADDLYFKNPEYQSEDCISRQAVLELAKNECETAVIPYKRFVKLLNALPPVQPKPKTDVLDKIRAEVEKEYLTEGHLTDYWDGIDKCLEIIDKHIADMRGEE